MLLLYVVPSLSVLELLAPPLLGLAVRLSLGLCRLLHSEALVLALGLRHRRCFRVARCRKALLPAAATTLTLD